MSKATFISDGTLHMAGRKFIFFVLLLLSLSPLFAQQYGGPGSGRTLPTGEITGTVLDSTTREPVEYTNIILYSMRDSSQITGTITNAQGKFRMEDVRVGRFFLEFRFIGYEPKVIADVTLRPDQPTLNLDTILITRKALEGQNVVVEGERPAIEYQIDKKVIDVSQQQTSASGDATDVLENVPSVRVDIEGNVSLRGSENFTVLIDGKPSVLEGSEALRQIPASSIETIEIITNPSAKYDPEGTSGIINVVLKEKKFAGSSGMVDLNAGLDQKYGGDLLYNYKNHNYTITLGANYNRRYFDGMQREERETSYQSSTSFIRSSGESQRHFNGSGFRAALEYDFSPDDRFTIGARYGNRDFGFSSDTDFRRWTSNDTTVNRYTNTSSFGNQGNYLSMSSTYHHQFDRRGHELSGEAYYSHRNGDGESINELVNPSGTIFNGQRTVETGPASRFRFKLDYVLPLGESRRLEAGYQGQVRESEDGNEQYTYASDTKEYIFQPKYSYTSLSRRNTQSIYSLFSDEIGRFGYKVGVRGEYTYRNIARQDSGAFFNLDRWDYFPSLHTSYSFAGTQQLMASYSRRINRPRGWFLEPFITWEDAYTVRSGNPSLVPEYIDSYELGIQTRLGKSMLTFETYYRATHNKIERVQSVYQEDITLMTIDNVGTDYSLGSEANIRMNLMKQWNLNLMGDIYHYRVEGTINDRHFSRESFNWGGRIHNTFRFGESWQIQFNGMYRSPSVSSQGRREGFFMSNLSLQKSFFEEKLSATLQIRDLFGTRQREFTSEGEDFYTYRFMEMESPVIMLNFQLNLNNYEQQRGQDPFPEEAASEGEGQGF